MYQRICPFLLIVLVAVVLLSCDKGADSPGNLLARYPDSIIYANQHLKFIYDADKRVIEERYQVGDTLEHRFTYEYNGTGTLPQKRNHFTRQSTIPDFGNVYKYNSSGRKILDSVVYPIVPALYQKTTFDYFAPGRIAIHRHDYTLQDDTVYISASGRIDSIRSYLTYSNGQPKFFWYTLKYLQFDNQVNVVEQQNTSQALFYNHLPNGGTSLYVRFALLLDYFNSYNVTSYAGISAVSGLPYYSYDKQIVYNSDNLPELVTVYLTAIPSETYQFRIVYTQ